MARSKHPFSRWLAARIAELGLSLGTVAECSGVAKSRLSQLISDPSPNPTVATLARLAITLDVEPAQLVANFFPR